MTELEVPQASIEALQTAYTSTEAFARAFAGPIQAAHLRRLAGDMELPADSARLRAAADELDGEGS